MSRNEIIKRILLSLLLGLSLGALMSEVSYQLLKRENREPMRIELVIPAGTAERVAAGETPPGIPEGMSFVIGDTLVVINQDNVDHQLGPMWVPAGTSASMNLATEESFSLECSFQPTRYFGLDVHPPVTLGTRISGIVFAGFPLSALFAVYSLLIKTDKKKKEAAV
jgi:hypothetical protein